MSKFAFELDCNSVSGCKFIVAGECEYRSDIVQLHNLLLDTGYHVSGVNISDLEES